MQIIQCLLGFRNALKGLESYSYLALLKGFPGALVMCGQSDLGYVALSECPGYSQCHLEDTTETGPPEPHMCLSQGFGTHP